MAAVGIVLALSLLVGCSGTSGRAEEGGEAVQESVAQRKLTVFAAASLTETLNELASQYREAHPEVEIVFNFDSSGTLKTQIQAGAECDIFISAGQRQMNQLDRTAGETVNPEGADYLLDGTRFNILENKVALVVAEGNPAGLSSYKDMVEALMTKRLLLAVGNADVPVGQYTQKIFTHFGLDEQALASDGVLTYGSNVKEVTTQVVETAVDAGIVYQTDAFSAKLEIVDTATPQMCGRIIYPAAIMKSSKQADEAKAFLDYLKGEKAGEAFERVGFTPVK